MYRVLVAEDSAVARMLLVRLLSQDPELKIVGEVGDGAAAVKAVERLRPDVVVMDIRMPRMDGLEATRAIMAQRATPIVLVTAAAVRSDMDLSFRALESGALAVLAKPGGPGSDGFEKVSAELVKTVKLMADVRVVGRRGRSKHRSTNGGGQIRARSISAPAGPANLVVIAASTGGPVALSVLLAGLPPGLPVPVMVVQHIGAGFDDGLVNWLGSRSALPVRLAQDGQPLRNGEVIVGPHGKHLGVSPGGRVVLSDSAPIGGHRPSATYLFRSAARAERFRPLGVILTGMGEDGVDGLVELKRVGGLVIAQDEATSVVYGMPARAIERGTADAVLPLENIASTIASATRPKG